MPLDKRDENFLAYVQEKDWGEVAPLQAIGRVTRLSLGVKELAQSAFRLAIVAKMGEIKIAEFIYVCEKFFMPRRPPLRNPGFSAVSRLMNAWRDDRYPDRSTKWTSDS